MGESEEGGKGGCNVTADNDHYDQLARQQYVYNSEAHAGIIADGLRRGESDSMDARPIVLHGSTKHTSGHLSNVNENYDLHSPLVKSTFDTFMSQPPYLFTFSTCGQVRRWSANASLHCSWKRSKDRKDVSIDSRFLGSPRW
jgi:hypothetical protein